MTSRPIGPAAEADFEDEWGCSYAQYLRMKADPRKPLVAFVHQRKAAKRRGIPFVLTFWQWWTIWQESGHWDERGTRLGQYVMSRNGDEGAYAVGNVSICTTTENMREYWSRELARPLQVRA